MRCSRLSLSVLVLTVLAFDARSAIAASLLKAQGFTNVENMTGGFGAWQRNGLPVVVPRTLSAAKGTRDLV